LQTKKDDDIADQMIGEVAAPSKVGSGEPPTTSSILQDIRKFTETEKPVDQQSEISNVARIGIEDERERELFNANARREEFQKMPTIRSSTSEGQTSTA